MHSFRRAATALRVRRIQSGVNTTARIARPPFTCMRYFHLEGVALAPLYFSGLFVALWTWKCCMLVTFQNKIIYMPGLPPNSRSEKIQDYANQCVGIPWREERVRAADGKDLALCVADVHLGNPHKNQKPVSVYYILYFQGNAASIPPRLPDLSSTLAMLKRDLSDQPSPVRLTFACLSYRGYWTSKGRPSERGIRLDSVASLDWISRQHEATTGTAIAASDPPATRSAKVILWGQSIGSGVATNLAAEYAMPTNLRLDSIILETPFTNLRAMLEVLYPQKWLPYKYLWPFLRNQLDSWKNMGMIYEKYRNTDKLPNIFILEAAKDELVPASLSQELYDRVVEVGLPVDKKAVLGAFHNDTMFRVAGRKAVSEFIAGRISKRV